MIYTNVLEAIGHTPIIKLSNKMVPEDSAEVLVKYEGVNTELMQASGHILFHTIIKCQ